MSSLWTPHGEHRVPRSGESGATSSPSESGPTRECGESQPVQEDAARAGGGAEPSEAELQEMAAALLAAPAEDVIANHCYGLFELAALHLSQRPANLEAARKAVDAMGFLVDGLGERLGRHAPPLSEGLTQLRLTWVKIADATTAPENDGDSAQS